MPSLRSAQAPPYFRAAFSEFYARPLSCAARYEGRLFFPQCKRCALKRRCSWQCARGLQAAWQRWMSDSASAYVQRGMRSREVQQRRVLKQVMRRQQKVCRRNLRGRGAGA